MTTLRTDTIKSIVTQDYRAAAIFEKYSLDFCCKGGVTVEHACAEKHLDSTEVLAELGFLLETSQADAPHFTARPVDELIDYIVRVHHAYVATAIPVIYAHTQKVAAVHGLNHPEVIEIARHFEEVGAELQSHMIKEEQILFPYMKSLVDAKRRGVAVVPPPFGSIENPISG